MTASPDDLSTIFARYDLDGDGRIDRDELRAALRDQRGAEPSEAHLDATLAALDEDGDGYIDLAEFEEAMSAFRTARG